MLAARAVRRKGFSIKAFSFRSAGRLRLLPNGIHRRAVDVRDGAACWSLEAVDLDGLGV
jgi:hypothetical protein